MKDETERSRRPIELGIREERVPVGSHVAYLWETEEEFCESVGFISTGLNAGDHCVVFGHEEANERVLEKLRAWGFETDVLRAEGRLSVLGGESTGDAILASIGGTFQDALDRGAEVLRLLGNIGWGHQGWPEQRDLLAFEAKVTEAAASFPCVVVCNYDIRSLGGEVMVHGAFETHPLTFCRNLVRENPHYCPVDEFLERLDEGAAT